VRTVVLDRADGRLTSSEGRPECSQLGIIEVHGSLFFGAIDHVQRQLQEIDERDPNRKHVLIVADGINFADIAGAGMLAREARRRRRMGGGLYLVGLKERTLDVLRTGGYLEEIGEENVFDDRSKAIETILGRLDPAACKGCQRRVFEECRRAPAEVRRRPALAIGASLAAAAFAEEGEVAAAREILAGDASGDTPGEAARPEPSPHRRGAGGRRTGSGT
jgi:SulP family sulfate permease